MKTGPLVTAGAEGNGSAAESNASQKTPRRRPRKKKDKDVANTPDNSGQIGFMIAAGLQNPSEQNITEDIHEQ